MHRDGCILSQLKRNLDEDPTGFPPPSAPQTFNVLPVSLSTCLCGWVPGRLSSPIPAGSGGEAQNVDRMVPPWGWKASLCL